MSNFMPPTARRALLRRSMAPRSPSADAALRARLDLATRQAIASARSYAAAMADEGRLCCAAFGYRVARELEGDDGKAQ